MLIVQYISLGLASLLVVFLIFWAFPLPHYGLILCYVLLILGLAYLILVPMEKIRKIIVVSVYFMVLINFCLNTKFYPGLLTYQAGNNAAKIIESEGIDPNDVFILKGRNSWSLDFYTHRITPIIDLNTSDKKKLKKGDWIFVYEDQLEDLKKHNLIREKEYEIDHYRITRLKGSFLNPATRDAILEKAYLIQLGI